MASDTRLRLDEVERRVCDIASEQLGIPRDRISPGDRIVEDLECDSLDLVELFMEVEEAFGVTLPDDSPNPVFKAVFTRQGVPPRRPGRTGLPRAGDGHARAEGLAAGEGAAAIDARRPVHPTRRSLGGSSRRRQGLFEPLKADGPVPQYRRRSDGMRCVLIPSASVEIGCDVARRPRRRAAPARRRDRRIPDRRRAGLHDGLLPVPQLDRRGRPGRPRRLVRARPGGRPQRAHARRAGRVGVATAGGHRAVADDPRLVVRGERLLALGQRAGLAGLPGRGRCRARELPADRGPVGVRRPRWPTTGRSRGATSRPRRTGCGTASTARGPPTGPRRCRWPT